MIPRRDRARRTARGWLALAASVALHGAAALALWADAASAARKPPAMRIYKVDIVSPPPSAAGPAMAEPPAESPGTPAPAPPAPATPTVPKPLAPVPEPEQPAAKAPRPSPPPERAEPAPAARPTTAPPARASAAKPPARTAAAPKAGATSSARANAAKPGAGTTGQGQRVVPATGARPVASSSAGEGLNVRTNGADFVDRAYLENIIRQVRRRFRPPPGARTDRASVRFWIERDGRVREMEMAGGQGSFAFRTAALEAVERAGTDGAFGPLPDAYPGNRLAITFDFSPPS